MFQERSHNRTALYFFLSLLLVLALPIAAKYFLNADIGLFSLLFIISAVYFPVYFYRIRREEYRWSPFLSAATVSIFALCILVGILITPLSAYTYWFESFRKGEPEGGVGTIFVLIVALFSVIVIPLYRKHGVLWPVLILAIVVSSLLAIIVQEGYLILVLVLLFIAAAVYQITRMVRSGSRLANSVFAVALIVTTLIVAAMFPDLAQARGSDFVSNTIFPSFRKAVVRLFPKFPLLYSVPGYGMSFDESNLGGRPHLVDSPVLEVEGPPGEVLYLRTRVFDRYNGASWTMSPMPLGVKSAQAAAVDFLSSDEKPSDTYLTLSVRARSFFYLPYTLNTKRIHFEESVPSVTGGGMETGFELARPLRAGTTMHLVQYEPDDSLPAGLSSDLKAKYLQIPSDLPSELRTIAGELAVGAASYGEILAKIEAFLAYNYTYSLDVDSIITRLQNPDAPDFAYAFLFEESSGYCVHFATSFILLARLAGIPARYATGFYTRLPLDEPGTTITGLSAHAWPEVWLEDNGWVNWEATPTANASNYPITGDEWSFNFNMELDQTTTRQLESLIGGTIAESGPAGDADEDAGFSVGRLFVAIGAVAGAAVLAFLAFRYGYPAVRFYSNGRGRMYHGLRRLTQRLERKGVPSPTEIGWIAWRERVKVLVAPETDSGSMDQGRDDTESVDHMIVTILGLTYGHENWRPEVTAQFGAFRKCVVTAIKRRNKRRDY